MKRFFDEYFKMIMYTVFGLILVMSSYMIIVNIHHYRELSTKINVSEADVDYINYKNNVNDIDELLNKYSKKDTKLFMALNNARVMLKTSGVFRLMPNTKLEYHDLYQLNDYFLNDLINDSWVMRLKEVNKNKNYDEMITILTNSSKYLDTHFIDNGLTLYDSYNESKIRDDYETILKNYLYFSNIILNMSRTLGG